MPGSSLIAPSPLIAVSQRCVRRQCNVAGMLKRKGERERASERCEAKEGTRVCNIKQNQGKQWEKREGAER